MFYLHKSLLLATENVYFLYFVQEISSFHLCVCIVCIYIIIYNDSVLHSTKITEGQVHAQTYTRMNVFIRIRSHSKKHTRTHTNAALQYTDIHKDTDVHAHTHTLEYTRCLTHTAKMIKFNLLHND